jgi:tRNA pseudouridine55 synthase
LEKVNHSGILILDKPDGPTSHDCVDKLRRLFRTRRIGHTGTLDPFATGVLVMLVGKATRLAQFFNEDEKSYEALVDWGSATDTGDRTGQVINSTDNPLPSKTKIEDAVAGMVGTIDQIPPMYSAIKIDGKPLYKMARKGITVERKAKTIHIREIRLLQRGSSDFQIFVSCSKGAYIRTLAEDLGKKLGGFAHLKELRRTASGPFRIDEAHKYDDLIEAAKADDTNETLARFLMPMNQALGNYIALRADDHCAIRIINGRQPLVSELSGGPATPGSIVRIIDSGDELLAMGAVDDGGEKVKLIRVLRKLQ